VSLSVWGADSEQSAKRLAPLRSILGSSPDSIDSAEDRSKFSGYSMSSDRAASVVSSRDALSGGKFSEGIVYPVLIRPSYVLSGSAMMCYDKIRLSGIFVRAGEDIQEASCCDIQVLCGTREVEVTR